VAIIGLRLFFLPPARLVTIVSLEATFSGGFRNMKTPVKTIKKKHQGIAMILAMVFIVIFSAISIGFLSLSSANTQVSVNHRDSNNALAAALSGLDCARYIIGKTETISTNSNIVTEAQAQTLWANLYSKLQSLNLGSAAITKSGNNVGDTITTGAVAYGDSGSFIMTYRLVENADGTFAIQVSSKGTAGNGTGIERKAGMTFDIAKDGKVLNYAIASRGRMWLTGDTTIHGSVYSAWNLSNAQLAQLSQLNEMIQQKMAAGTLSTSFATLVSSLSLSSTNRTTVLNELTSGILSPEKAAQRCIGFMTSTPSISPFNMTGDSTVLGSINTCWTKDQVGPKSWQFETWDSDGNPIYQTDGAGNILYETDGDGNYLYDDNGEMIKARYVNSDGDGIVETGEDEIQGICAGVNYGETPQNLAGMNIADYDTTEYYNATRTTNGGNGDIPVPTSTQYTGTDAQLASLSSTCGTKWRYEKFPHDSSNYTTGTGIQVKRYIYKNQTFSNVRLPADKNALFINCTFNNVLYVDAGKTTSNYNNVRFDNCNFKGTIVSNTPQTFNWQKNTLYFTGSATFQNNASADTTILAPHFNVNLGNTNPVAGTNNVLQGAIVGGIVDVRGNAEVFGTIISMADTSSNTSGYVTNIGATLNDGGSETVAIGDVGTINITPNPEKKLPSGITTPIIFDLDSTSYYEPRD
jgi:Tfp pilus assembly protein PilX